VSDLSSSRYLLQLTSRYADAPFVFDVYLNPTKFPHEPPVVHFHSHTFGKGRCNRKSNVKIHAG
jgi:ubiquitin-conjugating enzyme E2 O